MNAVIYARYSSHSQREESIEGQLAECHDFAERNGLTVIGEYCDRALSGKTDNRPEFQRLIKDSEKGRFQAVILYTLDRFARNRYDAATYKNKLKKHGVRLFYAKQPISDGPEGILLESILEGYAEYYSENLSRGIKMGLQRNALKCLATGGAAIPLGYSVAPDKTFQIDPVGARIVKEIFQMYADGMSVTQIIAHCNASGYKTSRGNPYNKNSLRKMLTNEKYIGTYKFMDVVVENGIPAIVDKALFDKVQSKLKHNAKARAKSKAHEDYLLTTKLFCGHCGSAMIGESGTSKSGKMHFYYKCADRKRKHNCEKKVEKKDWIEEIVVRYTVQKVLTDENIDLIATRAMELIEKEYADTSYLEGLKEELKAVNKKLKNIMTAIEEGMFTSTTKDRLQELEMQKADVETQIAKEEIKKPLFTKEHIMFWLHSFRNGDINDKSYQRKIVDILVNSVYLYDEDDGDRRIVFTFNLTGHNTATLKCSDITSLAPPKCANPNTLFFAKHCFGFVEKVKGVG